MQCNVCGCTIPPGDEREHNHRMLCEDCYMDVLSPVKFCDPWASYSAKSFVENNRAVTLTEHQQIILDTLKKAKGISPEDLMETLSSQMSPEEGARACAALNRMEKISIEHNQGSVMIRLKV